MDTRLWSWATLLLVGCTSMGASDGPPTLDADVSSAQSDRGIDGGAARDGGCAAPSCDAIDARIAPEAADTGSTAAVQRDGGCDAECEARLDAMQVSGAEAGADAALASADSGVGPNGRPVGVALCYSAESSGHSATTKHWDALRAGDLSARARVIEELKAAAMARPDEEEFALLLGLASLWRVAEPELLESLNPLLTLETIETAESELERAYKLCPSDHRIAAWLGPIKIRMGRMQDDPALVEEGFRILNQGIAHYPGFVLFSKLLVYADLPATDPDFLKAVDAVRENAVYCGTVATGLSSDPACSNHPRASHNIEGSAVFLGDMYAKAQDRAAAVAAYESAKATRTWASWDYQELLTQRIATVDARIAGARSDSALDDLEPAWASQIQCSLCHRE